MQLTSTEPDGNAALANAPDPLEPMAHAIWQVLAPLSDPEIPVVSLRDMGILRDVLTTTP